MTVQGAFVWYDLMTTDRAAAEAFYHSVVGWGARDSGMPGVNYTLFTAAERPVVGLMDLPHDAREMGVPPCWTGYVAVSDVDAAAAAMQASGGQMRKGPDDIPGVGRFAVVADPQGAVLCIFKGEGDVMEPPPAETPGHVGWHELMTSDLEAGFAFYAKHFGWSKADAMDMGEMGPYQMFAHDGAAIGGMMTRPPYVPVSYWGYYFNVPDIKAAIEKVTEGGGQNLHGPIQVPTGSWIAQCRDPQGAFFSLVAPN
jgi:predicted enzyme related to lactoylglutathione lyase